MRHLLTLALLTGCAAPITSTVAVRGEAGTAVEADPAPSPAWRSTDTRSPRKVPKKAARSRQKADPAVTGQHLNWRALAECESSNNPRSVSSSGKYRGLYQFDYRTWQSVGGTGDPAQASRAEQTRRAYLLYLARGRQPWPVCGSRL